MRRAAVLSVATLTLAALGCGCRKPPPPPPVAAAVPSPIPTPTPVLDTVIFVRAGALWVEHSTGAARRLLAVPGSNQDFWFPTVDPDGSGLLAWLSRGDGTQDVAHVDSSGAVRILTDTGQRAKAPMKDLELANGPSCSPDGSHVAYSFNGNLWIMEPSGLDPETLISDGATWSPAWSPDGKQIAYVNGIEGHRDLWVTAVDSRDTFQLTDFKDYTVGGPHWSPDGQRILVSRTRGDDSDIVSVQAKADTPATDADVLTHDHMSISGVFNPEGPGILFCSAKGATTGWNLYTQDASGNAVLEITRSGGLMPAWSSQRLSGGGMNPSPLPTRTATPATPVSNTRFSPTQIPTPAAQAPQTFVAAQASRTASAAPSALAPASPRTPLLATSKPGPPASKATALRLRLRVAYDGQDHLDAASLAALKVLSRRVRQYAGYNVDVVGPLDDSDLRGLYFSSESRSQSRARAIGAELARLAGTDPARVKADPYSPPAAGVVPMSILIYVELR